MQHFWMGFGFLVHGLFAVTVYYLFWYLRGVDLPAPTTTPRALAIDALLAAQFTVWHSLLLLPRVRTALTRWIPSAAYGICYRAVTCIALLAMIFSWQPCGDPLWDLHGGGQLAIRRRLLRLVGAATLQSVSVRLRPSNGLDQLVALGAGPGRPLIASFSRVASI